MMIRLAVFACAVFSLTCIGSPAEAGQHHWRWSHGYWRETREAISQLENQVARLEADPAVDDGYKAPIITRTRADILKLRATLPAARWRWTDPCCYSRKAIYIR
ncbi:MAG: hypothetical protein ACLPX7_28525 [Xanthobacteraceae bacterium]